MCYFVVIDFVIVLLFCNESRAVCSFGHALCFMRFAKASARHTVTLFKHEAVARSRSHLTSHMYIIPQVNICVVFVLHFQFISIVWVLYTPDYIQVTLMFMLD